VAVSLGKVGLRVLSTPVACKLTEGRNPFFTFPNASCKERERDRQTDRHTNRERESSVRD
jgi:hypothetical protein